MLLCLCLGLCLQTVIAAEEIDQKCPVEPGKNAKSQYYAEHSGQRIYFCCEECVEEFKRSPETYVRSVIDYNPPAKGADSQGYPRIQIMFDNVWNFTAKAAGLIISTLLLFIVCLLHFAAKKLPPAGRFKHCTALLLSKQAIPAWIALFLGSEAISAHLSHRITRDTIRDSTHEHDIHYTTFVEYGDPPLPSRPDTPARVKASFYRGNDERSPSLFNGGNYRTATFNIDLCTKDGSSVSHGDAVRFNELYIRVRFRRAAGTPDYFWKTGRMAKIYATRDPGKFHWRDGPPEDQVKIQEVVPMQEWVFNYPISLFSEKQGDRSVSGTLYICEKRYNDSDSIIGGRFHCAFSFDLHQYANRLTEKSDLWMGALYRKRSLRIWEIPESEWLSPYPIPEIPDGKSSGDPVLLGIHDHENKKN